MMGSTPLTSKVRTLVSSSPPSLPRNADPGMYILDLNACIITNLAQGLGILFELANGRPYVIVQFGSEGDVAFNCLSRH